MKSEEMLLTLLKYFDADTTIGELRVELMDLLAEQ